MRKLIMIAVMFISINTIAQNLYSTYAITFDSEEVQETTGVISVDGIKMVTDCDQASFTIVIDPATYYKDTNNFGNTMKSWDGRLVINDKISPARLTIIYFEGTTSFIIQEGEFITRIDANEI